MVEPVKRFKAAVRSRLRALIRRLGPDVDSINQQMQRSITTQYALCRANKSVPYQNIQDAGFRVHSQFEEDGIILYVLSMVGFKTRRVVEICAGNGEECMATNLILNHGFEGFLFDGDITSVDHAKAFFHNKRDCLLQAPVIRQAWITAEDINATLEQAGCIGEIDLLSLDIDGNDYWIWKAINIIQPRLIVAETHNFAPSDRSITIPYRSDFDYRKAPAEDFRGVSLLAMTRLCNQRGYRLIGAHRRGFNAFFLRNDTGLDVFPEVSIKSVHDNPFTRRAQANGWPPIKDMPWVEIS
jgi:hypothetical protein